MVHGANLIFSSGRLKNSLKMDPQEGQKNSCIFVNLIDFSMEETQLIYVTNVMTCALNTFFAVPAIVGNALVFFAIWKTKLRKSESNILLSMLALADFQVGLFVQTSFVAYKLTEIFREAELSCYSRFVNIVFGYATTAVSLLTLTAIAIERFLALHLHLRYKEIVTKTRILITCGCFWLIGFAVTSIYFIQRNIFSGIVSTCEVFSIVVTSVAYIKIYKIVKRHEREINSQRHVLSYTKPQLELSMKKYQRSTLTMVIVFMLSFLCYVPYSIVMIAKLKYGFTTEVKVAIDIFATLICINSSLNPVIYCWRLREIREAVYEVVRCNLDAAIRQQRERNLGTIADLPHVRPHANTHRSEVGNNSS